MNHSDMGRFALRISVHDYIACVPCFPVNPVQLGIPVVVQYLFSVLNINCNAPGTED